MLVNAVEIEVVVVGMAATSTALNAVSPVTCAATALGKLILAVRCAEKLGTTLILAEMLALLAEIARTPTAPSFIPKDTA